MAQDMTQGTEQVLVVLPIANREAVRATERMVLAIPDLLGDTLVRVKMDTVGNPQELVMELQVDLSRVGVVMLHRLAFWVTRHGGAWARVQDVKNSPLARAWQLLHASSGVLSVDPHDVHWAAEQLLGVEPGEDNRRRVRVELELAVAVGGQSTHTRDISEDGMFVVSRESPPLGEVIHLRVALPSGEQPVDARVVHVRGGTGADAGFAVRFINPPAAMKSALARVAMERAPPQRAATPMATPAVTPAASWPSQPLAVPAPVEMPPVTRPMRVLLVDDDRIWLQVLAASFKVKGVEVLQAANGAAALRILCDELMDLQAMLVDLHMPVMGGQALLKAVRDLGGEKDLFLYVVSADDTEDQVKRARAAGADDLLCKRVGAQKVVEAVMAAVAAGKHGSR